MAETYREEKPSLAGRFRRGDHLPEGEIVAIVITIVTGIIEIIINIIPIISTISTSIQSRFTIATCVVIRTIYPLYSIGVDYYFVVNAIEFCWRNIIVSRLFITYLSPLIMISFMSCLNIGISIQVIITKFYAKYCLLVLHTYREGP